MTTIILFTKRRILINDNAKGIFGVEDNKKAGDVLKANGISEIGEEDLTKM